SSHWTLDLALEFGVVEPSALTAVAPELAPLAAVNVPISGTLETRLNLDQLIIEEARFDLGFGAGTLKSEFLAGVELALNQGELHASHSSRIAQLRLVKLDFDLGGGASLAIKGSLDAITPGLIVGTDPLPPHFPGKLGIVLTAVPVAKFGSLWPPG